MKRIHPAFTLFSLLLLAACLWANPGDLRLERERGDGAYDQYLFTPQNGRLMMTDSGGNIVYANTRSPQAVTRTPAASPTSFRPDAARDSLVGYTVRITSSFSLTGSSSGSVFLEVSPDNTTWVEIARSENAQSGGLVVGVSITQTSAGTLSGYVPPGYYVRLRTVTTTSGSPGAAATFTYLSGQETLL